LYDTNYQYQSHFCDLNNLKENFIFVHHHALKFLSQCSPYSQEALFCFLKHLQVSEPQPIMWLELRPGDLQKVRWEKLHHMPGVECLKLDHLLKKDLQNCYGSEGARLYYEKKEEKIRIGSAGPYDKAHIHSADRHKVIPPGFYVGEQEAEKTDEV
jgi:hypothetical protein